MGFSIPVNAGDVSVQQLIISSAAGPSCKTENQFGKFSKPGAQPSTIKNEGTAGAKQFRMPILDTSGLGDQGGESIGSKQQANKAENTVKVKLSVTFREHIHG